MKDKWIEIYRCHLSEAGINESNYSDEEVLTISKGFMAPVHCEEVGIERDWVFELYWQALLTLNPAEVLDDTENGGIIDMDIFKQRIKNNQN